MAHPVKVHPLNTILVGFSVVALVVLAADDYCITGAGARSFDKTVETSTSWDTELRSY